MTISGWIFMTAAWGAIIWLCGFCLYELFIAEEDEPGERPAARSDGAPEDPSRSV